MNGIRIIPTIVIDGKIALEGRPTTEEVRKALGHTSN
jgi:predicted DsbA family dithiol-disulfide isomerase